MVLSEPLGDHGPVAPLDPPMITATHRGDSLGLYLHVLFILSGPPHHRYLKMTLLIFFMSSCISVIINDLMTVIVPNIVSNLRFHCDISLFILDIIAAMFCMFAPNLLIWCCYVTFLIILAHLLQTLASNLIH